MNKKFGIILGSGLTKFSDELTSPEIILQDNDSFHKFQIISGSIRNKNVILFSGRRHYYEGNSPEKILQNIDIAGNLGVTDLIITNAAGGLNRNFNVSDLMLITSHLNFLRRHVPSRKNAIIYSPETLSLVRKIAAKEKINLRFGSYCCNPGPMYETRSEIRFLRKLGIDSVGMSTVPEILYANKIGIRTVSFSCITNILTEDANHKTNHIEVVEAGQKAYSNFSKLLNSLISKL